MKPAIERIELSMEELERLLERARVEPLPEEDYQKLKAAVDTLEYLTELVADKDTTIRHLRQLLLPASTEKTKDVLAKAGAAVANPASQSKPEDGPEQSKDEAQPGHGRNGAEAFTGAEKVDVPHQDLKHGDRCRSVGKATSTGRRRPRCSCGSWDKRRWQPRSTRWNDCAAEHAGRSSRLKSRKGSARRSTTKRRRR